MDKIEINDSGYYEQSEDDLLKLIPAFEGEKKANVLDISNSISKLSPHLRERGGRTLITAVKPGARENKEDGDELIEGNIEDVCCGRLPENTYDVVYMGEALAGFVDPWRALEKLRRSIKDNGTLIVSIPNVGNYGLLYYLLMGKWEYREDTILDKSNLRFFTLAEAVKLFTEAGYGVDHLSARFSPHHGMVDKMADLVSSLGGDPQRFKDESIVQQYYIRFKKSVHDFAQMDNEVNADLKEMHSRAFALYNKKEYGESSKIYMAILKENEKDEKGILGLAKCFEGAGSHDFALKCFVQLLELNSSPINIIEYAHYHVRLGNHSEVVSILAPFLEKNFENLEQKDYAQLLKIIGNSYVNMGELDKAEDFYMKSYPIFMELGIERGIICVNLGSLELQRGNHDKARTYFNRAIEMGESRAKALSGLGMSEMLNDIERAEVYFCKSLDEDITCVTSLFNLVQLAYKKKKYSTVIGYLEHYIKVKPLDLEMKYTLAGLHYETGNRDKVLVLAEEILSVNPEHKNTLDLKVLIGASKNVDKGNRSETDEDIPLKPDERGESSESGL